MSFRPSDFVTLNDIFLFSILLLKGLLSWANSSTIWYHVLTNYCAHYSPGGHFVFVPSTKASSWEKVDWPCDISDRWCLNLQCRISLQILLGFSDILFYVCFSRKYVVSASIDIQLQCRNLQERNILNCGKIKPSWMQN